MKGPGPMLATSTTRTPDNGPIIAGPYRVHPPGKEGVTVILSRWSVLAQASALSLVLLTVDVLGPTGVAPFIYFQF